MTHSPAHSTCPAAQLPVIPPVVAVPVVAVVVVVVEAVAPLSPSVVVVTLEEPNELAPPVLPTVLVAVVPVPALVGMPVPDAGSLPEQPHGIARSSPAQSTLDQEGNRCIVESILRLAAVGGIN